MIIYLAQKFYIISINIQKILKNILAKYLHFVDRFLKKLAIKLPEYLNINKKYH